MKQNLLFIINNLNCGGAEKALVSLLESIDYSKYNVDLFLFKHEGLFLEKVPKQVHVLKEPEEYKYFDMPIRTAIIDCLRRGRLQIIMSRIGAGYIFRSEKNRARCDQRTWKFISLSMHSINKAYDAAIGFLENNPIYFCIDKVKAKRKIGWIHIDYNQLGMDPAFDIQYFNKLTNLVTVSEECANILKSRFPSQNHKVDVIHNIVSPKVINKMAAQTKTDLYNKKDGEIIVLSIGRLHYQKGFELAIGACKMLVDKGYNIKWHIIGEGGEREKLTGLIQANKLERHFVLLGLKTNPYPYIKQADIYAQTSRFEGKSIAVDEAKILHKPILVTNFSTAKDQIAHGENGLIVEMNQDAIANGLEKLINDKVLRNRFVNNLLTEKLGTEEEINKLYALL